MIYTWLSLNLFECLVLNKKSKILINIVLLFTFKTGRKIKNFDFKIDSPRIEKVINFNDINNDLILERIIEIKNGDTSVFVERLTINNGNNGILQD